MQHIAHVFATYRVGVHVFATCNPHICTLFLYLQYINLYLLRVQGPENLILCVRISLQNDKFRDLGHFWGRRGSPRVRTLGKRSHAAHEPF